MFTYPFGPFLDDISLSFVVGIVLAAVLSTFLPYDSLSQYGITNGLPAILLMLVISLPIYICSISSIPVALTCWPAASAREQRLSFSLPGRLPMLHLSP